MTPTLDQTTAPRLARAQRTTDTEADDACIVEILNRNPDGLRALYARYASLVFRVARRTCRDVHAAEDVTQEVFVYLWNHAAQYESSRGRIGSWLAITARNRAIDLIRARESAHRREVRVGAYRMVHLGDTEEIVAEHQHAEMVRAAVRRLPERERLAIELAYFGHLTYAEVALAMDLPEGTTKSVMRRALHRLASDSNLSTPPRRTAGAIVRQ